MPAEKTRVRLSGPQDVLTAVPYLLGFAPSESVVVLLVEGGRVKLTARLDLDEAERLPSALGSHVTADTEAVVVVYTRGDPAAVAVRLAGYHDTLRVLTLVITNGSRYWTDADLDGPGTPVTDELAVAAEMVGAGAVVLGSRDELLARVRPSDAPTALHAAHQVQRRRLSSDAARWPVIVPKLVGTHLAEGTLPDATTTAMLTAMVSSLTARDAALAVLTRENGHAHARLWSHVITHSAPEDVAGPLALYGVAAYLHGSGAELVNAIDQLDALHPDYGITPLLAGVLARAIPPAVLQDCLSTADLNTNQEN